MGGKRTAIIAKYGVQLYETVKANLLAKEQQVLEMVRGVGVTIAAPGTSPHRNGKAVDISGPNSTVHIRKRFEIVTLVAQAHPDLFKPNGVRKEEKQNCVHFEIR